MALNDITPKLLKTATFRPSKRMLRRPLTEPVDDWELVTIEPLDVSQTIRWTRHVDRRDSERNI